MKSVEDARERVDFVLRRGRGQPRRRLRPPLPLELDDADDADELLQQPRVGSD